MLKKVLIRNYRVFRNFELELSEGMNLIVGDNDAGKSTLLQAINLALTCRLNGYPLGQELSSYLINRDAVAEYLDALSRGDRPQPPEFIIELYLDDTRDVAVLQGMNNLLREDASGIRLRATLDEEFADEYTEYLKDTTHVKLVPTEYYRVEWLGFSGEPLPRKKLVTASLIDATVIKLQSGVDNYLQGVIGDNLEPRDRVELSRSYRSLRESFSETSAVTTLNEKLTGSHGDISDRPLSLSIDVSQRSAWERTLVPHLDEFPFQYIGNGEQSIVKILLALNRRATDCHVVLVEEPENHLSFSSLNILLRKIADKCKDKQVLVTTHSSFVLNKLGLANLILLSHRGGSRITQLPPDTVDYFKKLSGYDTLRLVLAKGAILVEGPSDELIVLRAYKDVHGRYPIEDGIDVINVRGLSAKRFLDIAVLLKKRVVVLNDNDGNEAAMRARYDGYHGHDFVFLHVGQDDSVKTLEPQILAANDRPMLNEIFDTDHGSDDELLKYMQSNKTTCALAIFEAPKAISMPEYIRAAVIW